MTMVLPSAFCMSIFLFLMRVFKELNSSDEILFLYLQLSFKSLWDDNTISFSLALKCSLCYDVVDRSVVLL